MAASSSTNALSSTSSSSHDDGELRGIGIDGLLGDNDTNATSHESRSSASSSSSRSSGGGMTSAERRQRVKLGGLFGLLGGEDDLIATLTAVEEDDDNNDDSLPPLDGYTTSHDGHGNGNGNGDTKDEASYVERDLFSFTGVKSGAALLDGEAWSEDEDGADVDEEDAKKEMVCHH